MKIRLTRHAEEELDRRGIPRNLLDGVLAEPQQVVPGKRRAKGVSVEIRSEGW